MKKTTLLLVFLLVIACFSSAYAKNEAVFTVEDTSIPSGGTGTVIVRLTGNPGTAGFSGTLVYDQKKLTITKTEVLEFSDMVFAVNPENGQFAGLSLGGNSTQTGMMFRVTFQVKDGVKPGDTEVSVSVEKCGNYLREAVATTVTAGTVTITQKQNRLPGDVNKDGKVNGKDVTRLAKYVAGNNDVEIDETASDVTGDHRVDGRDLLRLVRYQAGQDVNLE